ncbi:hypothetical protein CH302_12795 [Rhodococcus sp. 15-2388-1-1a]|nr:hypothetical protein CH302_12795 [Rhodococcus sp. 15-2388-1-1a]
MQANPRLQSRAGSSVGDASMDSSPSIEVVTRSWCRPVRSGSLYRYSAPSCQNMYRRDTFSDSAVNRIAMM